MLLATRPPAVRQFVRGRLYQAIEAEPAIAALPMDELERRLTRELERILATGPAAMV